MTPMSFFVNVIVLIILWPLLALFIAAIVQVQFVDVQRGKKYFFITFFVVYILFMSGHLFYLPDNDQDKVAAAKIDIDNNYKQGMDFLHKGKYEKALKLFDEILKTEDNKKAKIMRAACFLTLSKHDEARNLYIGNSFADKIVSGNIFRIISSDKIKSDIELRDLLKLCTEILNIDSTLKEIWHIKGNIYLAIWAYESKERRFSGNFDEKREQKRIRERELEMAAIKCFNEAVRIDPNYEPSLTLLKKLQG